MLRQRCSLSMLHRTSEKVMGMLVWVDWACPISCMCLFILILSSYDDTALFTSVPVEPALGIAKDLFEQDNTIKERTVLPVKDVILL